MRLADVDGAADCAVGTFPEADEAGRPIVTHAVFEPAHGSIRQIFHALDSARGRVDVHWAVIGVCAQAILVDFGHVRPEALARLGRGPRTNAAGRRGRADCAHLRNGHGLAIRVEIGRGQASGHGLEWEARRGRGCLRRTRGGGSGGGGTSGMRVLLIRGTDGRDTLEAGQTADAVGTLVF